MNEDKGTEEMVIHNAHLHNNLRRAIERVAAHAAAEDRTLRWVADELATALDDPANHPRVWSLPRIPDDVTAIRDGDGDVWLRKPDGCWACNEVGTASHIAWSDLLEEYGPLVEVTDLPTELPVT